MVAVICLFIGAIVGFFVCFFCFANNVEFFTKMANFLKDKRGSIEVSPVPANTLVKYLLRFGIPLTGVFALVGVLKPDMIETMLYKCCLIFAGYVLAELIWVIGYKRTFDRQEKEGRITDVGRIAILIFRGLLLGSVIVGLTLGL
jgi:hypothetical protein